MGVFAEKMKKRLPLDTEEIAFLDALEAKPVSFAAHQILARAGDPAHHAFVLQSGWAMSYTRFASGSHQVRRLHFPGDLLAMPSVSMCHHVEDVETLSGCIIAPFDKRLLAGLFKLPRLAAVMYMFAQAERISAGDRLSCLGGTKGKGRLAFLIADILTRLRSVEGTSISSFRMHLTREQMGYVTGMSAVHASRMWSRLIIDGLIRWAPPIITVLDEDRLLRLSGYLDRDRDFDFGWLSGVTPEDHHPELTSAGTSSPADLDLL